MYQFIILFFLFYIILVKIICYPELFNILAFLEIYIKNCYFIFYKYTTYNSFLTYS